MLLDILAVVGASASTAIAILVLRAVGRLQEQVAAVQADTHKQLKALASGIDELDDQMDAQQLGAQKLGDRVAAQVDMLRRPVTLPKVPGNAPASGDAPVGRHATFKRKRPQWTDASNRPSKR